MKLRTQIQIEKEEHDALRTWARRRGISLSAAVRWLIREKLQMQSRPANVIENVLSASGAISCPGKTVDVSQKHDLYLYGDDKADP